MTGMLDTFSTDNIAAGHTTAYPVTLKAVGGFGIGFSAAYAIGPNYDRTLFNNVALHPAFTI